MSSAACFKKLHCCLVAQAEAKKVDDTLSLWFDWAQQDIGPFAGVEELSSMPNDLTEVLEQIERNAKSSAESSKRLARLFEQWSGGS